MRGVLLTPTTEETRIPSVGIATLALLPGFYQEQLIDTGNRMYLEIDPFIDKHWIEYLPVSCERDTIHGLLLYLAGRGEPNKYSRVGKFMFKKETCVKLGIKEFPPTASTWPPAGFEWTTFKIY